MEHEWARSFGIIKGVWTQNYPLNCTTLSSIYNDPISCRCRCTSFAYRFWIRPSSSPDAARTLPGQVIKRRLTRTDGDENLIALLFRRLLIPPLTTVAQLNALICFASCNFSPPDFRRGDDYGGFERLRVRNNNYCCLAKSSKRDAAYKVFTLASQHPLDI